ncbi:MAG TPA: ABC transporter permease [Streptosporangiaceae bacterium]|jgi:ABC-type lipoprotein release transport system permease subunit
MFFTYLRRELRRRIRQAIVISLGLALGIGLVITVTALSAGVKDAQGTVLHSLYGVGTDITVTQPPTAGAAGGFGVGFSGQAGSRGRPAPGTAIHADTLRGFSLAALKGSAVTSITAMPGVAAAAGGLTLTDSVVSGKIPAFSAGGGFGGGGGASGGGSGGGGAGRFRGSFNVSTFGVQGVDIAAGELGPLSSGKITAGRTFTSADASADRALVDSGYARQHKLKTGSAVTVAGHKFTVIGLVGQPQGGNPPAVYIPLARAQQLATPSMSGQVNSVYVTAASSAQISAVSKEISAVLPKATVTTSSDLASEVTGSLASTSSLANNLGKWLAIAVLIAAFLLASLLTMGAVARRVREFGTLKALGWRSRRVIGQVMGEALVLGVIGGAAGVGLGYLGAALVARLSPPLSASVGVATGNATPGGSRAFGPGGGFGGGGFGGRGGGSGGGFRRFAASAGHTVAVHLTAPVTLGAIAAAVLLAVTGGLIAGMVGGWRAARLRPAAALARVE